MKLYGFLAILASVILMAGFAVMLGCGDDDDDNDSGGGDDDDSGGGAGTLSAVVHDFQTKMAVQDAVVELVDNVSGDPLGDQWKLTSPSDGNVTFTGIPEGVDLVGVKVTKAGYKDTYQYDFNVGASGEEFLVVGESTADLVALILGVTLDPTKGFAAGGIYWGDPTDENPVGCAVVETDPAPESGIYYFGPDDLPTPDRNVDSPENAANGLGVNPLNGYWVGMNIPAGEVDITAYSGDNVQTSFIPKVFPDSVCIANVYYSKTDFTADPTQAFCTE